MSNNIDKRIVEMQFDNKQFEKGIQTSIQSLDHLKQNLKLDQAAKSLDSLSKAGRSFSLASMNDSITAISNRFSTMGIIGMTVLQNITNAAYNCGKRMMNALMLAPLRMGFSEYETQIGAVQTILANTSSEMDALGYDQQQRLDIVNSKLDELNTYADKTIYNFTEMTRNIGTFTAAGVELDTAVSSIKGISNLAAVSGSTSQQASTAMYQLSQAISTGRVALMDWNSVVNAGMGGELFQNALIRTAANMGVVGDEAKEMFAKLQAGEVSFRDSLYSGWLSSDVLTETLGQISMDFEQIAKANDLLLENGIADIEAAKNLMRSQLSAQGYGSDDIEAIIGLAETATDAATKVKTLTQLFDTLKESMQSGWTQSWEYIVGDFEEAKAFLTEVSDYFGGIIGASADARNAMLADWKALGGRNELIESFWNIIHSIENVTGTIKDAFREFFPPTTGEQLFNITQKISDFTAKIQAATENSELMGKVSRVFRGVAAALDIVKTAAEWAWEGFKKLLGMGEGAAGGFLDFLAGIGDSVVGLRDTIKSSDALQKILAGLGNTAVAVRDVVVGGIKKIGNFFISLWNQIQGSGIITKVGDFLSEVLGKIPEFINKIGEWGSAIIDWVRNCDALKNAWNSIKDFFEPIIGGIADFGKKLWEAIVAFFGTDVSGDNLWDRAKSRFAAFGEKMVAWFSGLKPKLEEGWEHVKVFVNTLFTKTIPEFFANLKMDAIQKWPWLEGVFAFFEEAWLKAKDTCGPAIEKIQELGVKLWEAIKNLFGGKNAPREGEMTFGESIRDIVVNTWDQIKGFFSNFFSTTIPQWFDKFKGMDWGKILKTAFGIFTGIKLIKAISGIGKLGSGLSAIGNGLKGVGGLLEDIGKNGLTVTKVFKIKDAFATSLLKIAGSIAIMVGAIVVLSNMEAEKAWKGIGMLALIAGELLIVTALFKKIDANCDSLLRTAGAIALMVAPVYLLGHMDIDTALKGVIGIGIILTELALFMRIAGKGMQGKQSFLRLAIAINLLVLAVKGLGNMDTGAALKGMVSVGLILTELALFMRIAGKGMIGKQSFLNLAISVNLLVLAVKGLGNMDTGAALKGVIALGTILLELSLFTNKTNTKKMTGLISMALSLNLLARAVRKVGSLNTKTILKGVIGIGTVMAAFSLMLNTTKGMNFGSSMASLLAIVGSIILFIEAFEQIEGMNTDDMVKFAASLGTMMLSISAAMKILSTVPITGALSGIANFAIFVAGVGAVIAALGWLQNDILDLSGLLDSGGNVMQKLGSAIGQFIGGIGSGILTGVNLPTVGRQLSDFYTNAEPFLTGMTTLSIPNYNFWEMIFGVTKFTTFANDIKQFALGLKAYATEISGFEATVTPQDSANAIAAAEALSEFAKTLPENSFWENLFGISDLGTFSNAIPGFAAAMEAYATQISGFSSTVSEADQANAIAAAEALSEFAKTLPENSFWENLFGISDLGTFSSDIEYFGEGLKTYATSVSNIGKLLSDDDVADLSATISSLGDMIQNLGENTNTYTDLWTISGALGDFGTQYAYFVQKLNESGVSTHQESALTIVREIAEIIVSLADIRSVYDISDYIKWIADDLATFATKTKDLDTEGVVKIGTFIRNITESALLANDIGDTSLTAVQELLDSFSTLTIPEFNLEGEAAALAYISSLVLGIQNGVASISNAAIVASNQAAAATRLTYVGWRNAGNYLGIGLGSGITSATSFIRNAAVNAARSAINAVRNTWDENSPSKVGIELGKFWDLGLAGGIANYGHLIAQSAENVGVDAIQSAQSVLNSMEHIGSDIDDDFTIRPVMDLTDILNGMNDIDGLFSGERMISSGYFSGLIGIRSARALASEQGKNMATMDNNRDVVSELVTLEKKFDELSTAVRNMRIVLDTGIVAGEITEKVDGNLGALASRRGRGN